MVLTLLGITTLSSDVQWLKASVPIVLSVEGRLIVVSFLQPLQKDVGISVTPSGIVRLSTADSWSRPSISLVVPSANFMLFSDAQLLNE